MDDIKHYSNEAIEARGLEKQREEFADLQNELAGRDTGKMSRFVSDEERKKRSGQDPRSEATRTQLQLAMMNPQYAALYNNVSKSVGDAQNLLYQAMIENSELLAKRQKALEDAIEQNLGEEKIKRRRNEYEDSQERQRHLEGLNDELTGYQERMDNPNDAVSAEELEAIKSRTGEIENELNTETQARQKLEATTPEDTTPNLDLSGLGPALS